MYKRIGFIPVFAIVLILVLAAAGPHLPPIRQAVSGAAMPVSGENVENSIYLPLVIRKRWSSICYAPGTEDYQPPTPDIPEIILQQGTTITVTTNADTINGDVSGVCLLYTSPSPRDRS